MAELSDAGTKTKTVESLVPARMDRLPFGRWHVLAAPAGRPRRLT